MVRHRSRAPTPLNFKFYVRAITLSQFFKEARGSSYEMDDGTSYLVELKDLKLLKNVDKIEDSNEIISNENDDITSDEDSEFLEQVSNEVTNEEHALARLSGYVLYKTIKKTTCNCRTCIDYYTTSHETEQSVNSLIDHTDYKPGALTRPSEIGNAVFKQAEIVFRLNRKKLCGKPKMGQKMTELILQNLPVNFGNLPKCHLELIFKRFVKIRFHFWINFQNSIDQRDQKYLIVGESNSSRSMKAKFI